MNMIQIEIEHNSTLSHHDRVHHIVTYKKNRKYNSHKIGEAMGMLGEISTTFGIERKELEKPWACWERQVQHSGLNTRKETAEKEVQELGRNK